jgi:hypothetical protein
LRHIFLHFKLRKEQRSKGIPVIQFSKVIKHVLRNDRRDH